MMHFVARAARTHGEGKAHDLEEFVARAGPRKQIEDGVVRDEFLEGGGMVVFCEGGVEGGGVGLRGRVEGGGGEGVPEVEGGVGALDALDDGAVGSD